MRTLISTLLGTLTGTSTGKGKKTGTLTGKGEGEKAANGTAGRRRSGVMATVRRGTAAAGAVVAVAALAAVLPSPAHAGGPVVRAHPASGKCGPGELCLWSEPGFKGARQTHELAGTDIESCVPLGAHADALALANRTGRPVTTYQSVECQETAEFDTYPGGGTWVPKSPYRVRAFKIWER